MMSPFSPLLLASFLMIAACAHEVAPPEKSEPRTQVSLLSGPAESRKPPTRETKAATGRGWESPEEEDAAMTHMTERIPEANPIAERDIASVSMTPEDEGAFRLGPVFWSIVVLVLFGIASLFVRGRRNSVS